MKRALKALLRKLEALDEEHDGLGDTNVREHMGEHVLRAFLRPEPGFVPDGEYGLDRAANRKVATALVAFCEAATRAARRDGLEAFEQRVAAFQDPGVVGPGGSTFEDYFGIIVPASARRTKGARAGRPAKPGKAGRRAVRFTRDGTLDALAAALNAAGPWQWFVLRQYRQPFLEAHPGNWLWGKIRAVKPPGQGFLALLEAEAEAETGVDELVGRFRSTLNDSGAGDVAVVDPGAW